MANQDVVLRIVTQVDTSASEGVFGQMASQLTSAFDVAMETIANRLRDSVIRGVRAGAQGALDSSVATPAATSLPSPGEQARFNQFDEFMRTNQALVGAMNQLVQRLNAGAAGGGPAAPGAPGGPGGAGGAAGGAMPPGGIAGGAQAGAAGQQPQPGGMGGLGLSNDQLVRIVQGVGGVMVAAGALPAALRGGRAAEAEMGDLRGRMLIRGQFEEMAALGQIGGTEGARGRAQNEELLQSLGKILGGVATGVVGIATGNPLLGLGGGAAALSGVQGLANLPQNVQQNIEQQVQSQMKLNFEQMQGLRAGRETAVGAFRGAQAMGAPELSGFLAGGFGDPRVMQRQFGGLQAAESTDLQMAREGRDAGRMHRDLIAEKELSDPRRVQQMVQIQREIDQARPFDVQGREGRTTLRQFAVGEAGLPLETFQATMAQLAGGLGGVFAGQAPTLQQPGQMQGIARLLQSQGQGLAQAPDIAGGLFQAFSMPGVRSEQAQRQALEMTSDMFEDAVAAGMDKAAVGKALVQVAQRAQTLGPEGARAEFEQQLSAAQQIYGKNFSGSQFETIQNLASTDRTRGAMGAGAAGGVLATQSANKKFGLNMDPLDQFLLRQAPDDPNAIAGLLRATGKGNRAGEAEDIAEFMGPERRQQEVQARIKMYGGGKDTPQGRKAALVSMIQEGIVQPKDMEAGMKWIERGGAFGAPEMPFDEQDLQSRISMQGGASFAHRLRRPPVEGTGQDILGKDVSIMTEQQKAALVTSGLQDMGTTLKSVNEALGEFNRKLRGDKSEAPTADTANKISSLERDMAGGGGALSSSDPFSKKRSRFPAKP